jgi:hypothetical protein
VSLFVEDPALFAVFWLQAEVLCCQNNGGGGSSQKGKGVDAECIE